VQQVTLAKSIQLGAPKVDIADRCLKAQQEIALLLAACGGIDCVALEDFVWMSPTATIPQALVKGAVLAELRAHGLTYCLIAPSTAKKTLAGAGDASKRAMLEAAAPHFGHDSLFPEFRCKRESWSAWMNSYYVYDEHAADALGIALAASGKTIEVVA
jgi:Holliday junction resolvasome RuvABC endonuclease subunit